MGIELQFLNLIQEIRTTFLDVFMSNVTKLGNVGFIWILLTIILLVIPKTRKSGVILAAALIVDLILCNVILKPLVARIRPFDVNTAIQLIIAKPQDYSFPSGHTAASVASVVALYLAGEKRLWTIARILLCFSCESSNITFKSCPSFPLALTVTLSSSSKIPRSSCFTERTFFVVSPSTFCIRKRTSFPSSAGPNRYCKKCAILTSRKNI